MTGDQEAKNLFNDLTIAEKHHQASLLNLYQEVSGLTSESGFPGSVLSPETEGDVMEGAIRRSIISND